jgi:hypothetical protein
MCGWRLWSVRDSGTKLGRSAPHELERKDPTMEEHQALSGPAGPGGHARWRARRMLPWIGVLLVLTAGAYVFDWAAAGLA